MNTERFSTPTGEAGDAAVLAHAFPRDNDDITTDHLRDLYLLRQTLDTAIRFQVEVLTDPSRDDGDRASWGDIGRVLGVTRQAAQQRYARPNYLR